MKVVALSLIFILSSCEINDPNREEKKSLSLIAKNAVAAELLVYENNLFLLEKNNFRDQPTKLIRKIILSNETLSAVKKHLRKPCFEYDLMYLPPSSLYTHEIKFYDNYKNDFSYCLIDPDSGWIKIDGLSLSHEHTRNLFNNIWGLLHNL